MNFNIQTFGILNKFREHKSFGFLKKFTNAFYSLYHS